MAKNIQKIRDPVHVFVRLNNQERKVLNSRPCHIHQLELTYLVYPGATHKRFEHSLVVMELTGRAFDVVASQESVSSAIQEMLEPINNRDKMI